MNFQVPMPGVKNQEKNIQTPYIKEGAQTAEKQEAPQKLEQSQDIKIRTQIFSLFKNEFLRGKFKVQNFVSLVNIEIIFYHKVNQIKIKQNVRLSFGSDYPQRPPSIYIHSCNLTKNNAEYQIPEFLSSCNLLSSSFWSEKTSIADILSKIYENIDNFHRSEVIRIQEIDGTSIKMEHSEPSNGQEKSQEIQQQQNEKKKYRRKSSYMTGCADRQLTETKNLNRHFRSKLREVLRDMIANQPDERPENSKFIDQIFTPNRVGFEDIRRVLQNKWFNYGVRKQMNSGQFLHKILRGMMGIKSKKLMIKYYHVMVSAVQQPSSFIRWKYD